MGKFFYSAPLITPKKRNTQTFSGGVAEWLNAPVLKTDVGESLPWVRIPPPPPHNFKKHQLINDLKIILIRRPIFKLFRVQL